MTFLTFCTRPRGNSLPWLWPLFSQTPWPWLLYGSVALSHALTLWLSSHLTFSFMHRAASVSLYPLSHTLSSLVSSCLILPILCPCYSYLFSLHTTSLSPPSSLTLPFTVSFPSFPPSLPLLWRSGMMQSRRARPCLITLIKHPVR